MNLFKEEKTLLINKV